MHMVNAVQDMAKKSAQQAAQELGITRVTMNKWILQKKVRVVRREIGKMTYYEIDEQEVERLRSLMVKKRQKGKPLIR